MTGHRRAGRGRSSADLLRRAAGDTLRMLRDWRPPEHPGPDEEDRSRVPRRPRVAEPTWGRAAPAQRARRALQDRALFPLLTRLGRPEVLGAHHLQAARPPYILAPNHVSHSDAPLVLQALPPEIRERTLVPAAADYFFERRGLGVAVTLLMNAVPFDRRNEIADSVRRCERFLRHGFSIVLFPEGTRSQDGRLRGFKAGVAHLAVGTGAPVVPVYIQGSHRLLPRGRALPRPSAVCVHFGEPLTAAPGETARRFNDRIEAAVTALAAGARGYAHRDREPERRSWRESWTASLRPALDPEAEADASWWEPAAAGRSLPAPATAAPQVSWIARWRATTPR